MKNIGVLTSSRADYGIYKPLLRALKNNEGYNLHIISFGTHLSPYHGYTIDKILDDGYEINYRINSLLLNDDENSVATGYALTALKFANFWTDHANDFDLVFCLGDRFEMFGAVSSGIPYQIKFAHIHGGETTLGAIDNTYRHCISLVSSIHFTSTEEHRAKVINLTGSSEGVFNVGALSLDGIENEIIADEQDFRNHYSIPDGEYVLTTFHPESKNSGLNYTHVKEMSNAIKNLVDKLIVVITMPNADTLGSLYRKEIASLKEKFPTKIVCIENFGRRDYFTAMKYSSFMLGNSSSGIIEAATFNNYVVNVGTRQKGRTTSDNIIQTAFRADDILKGVNEAQRRGVFNGENKYYTKGTSSLIINVLDTAL